MSQLFRGVTTNPPLSLAAIKDDPPYWQKVAQKVLGRQQGPRHRGPVLAALQRGRQAGLRHVPAAVRGVGHKEGFLSGQVDPRSAFDGEAMLKQALEIHAVNPNVMVKVPGTAEGYPVIEELTARGIATNNTLTFVLSQLWTAPSP
jgi:transaldolase